jgi:hypothetical protein
MQRIIKTYEEFGPRKDLNIPLALPPHKEEEESGEGGKTLKLTLKELYELDHKDIMAVGNRMNAFLEEGTYLKIKDLKANFYLIEQSEPLILFGIKGGNKITFGGQDDIPCKNDSIVIRIKSDDSILVLSASDNYEFSFVRPKIMISAQDPYGEEDWEEE